MDPYWVAYGDQRLAAYEYAVAQGTRWATEALRAGKDPLLLWAEIADRTKRVVIEDASGPYELAGVLAAAFIRAARAELEGQSDGSD